MGKIRVYCKKNLETSTEIRIEDEDFHYLRNVMRLNVGQEFFLFNERDGEFQCEVQNVAKKFLNVSVKIQTRSADTESIREVELIFPPIRHSRLDFLIEKATELGIKTLSPIVTQNTAVKDINVERLETIAKEATEQSRRLCPPVINGLEKFTDKISKFDFENRGLIYLDERQNVKENTVDILKKFTDKPVSFIIGPEGGFSADEFEILSNTKAVSVSLGSRILRAETAGMAILAIYNIGLNDQK